MVLFIIFLVLAAFTGGIYLGKYLERKKKPPVKDEQAVKINIVAD